MNTLKAEKRSMDIKAKNLRREGFVTGNVFGKEIQESIPIKLEKSAVERLLKTSNKGSQIMLEIAGEAPLNALIKDIEYNSMKGQINEIDFQALVNTEKVHSVAEVVLVNHDKLAAGLLQQKLHEIAYKALPSALVDKVKIDAAKLHIGDTILVKDLEFARSADIDLITDPEAAVVTVTEVHTNAAEAAEDEAPAAE